MTLKNGESNNTISMCVEEAMGMNQRENDVISALIASLQQRWPYLMTGGCNDW